MLTKAEFISKVRQGLHILDGATGSNLRNAGMPQECCAEEWILNHPEPLVQLQKAYAAAGCQIIYAPTFQAQPLALERVGLHKQTEQVNAALVALSRSAAPGCLIAGNLTTMAAYCDTWDERNFDRMLSCYRRQIRGLIDGGADLLAAETLISPGEAEAIMTAAELEGASCVLYSFTMLPDGALFSGQEVGPIFKELEKGGASAVGFNCVGADQMTPALVAKLRRYVQIPLACKPNAGTPFVGTDYRIHYPMEKVEFARILAECHKMGADLLGGCCGTDPSFLAEYTKIR